MPELISGSGGIRTLDLLLTPFLNISEVIGGSCPIQTRPRILIKVANYCHLKPVVSRESFYHDSKPI